MGRARIIAVSNQKGGVGKTTTSAAMAAGLKDRGYRVLAVDFDPQSSLTYVSGVNVTSDTVTIYETLHNETSAKEAIVSGTAKYDIIPARLELAGYELELCAMIIGREQRLKEALTPVMDEYDYIIIDTPPTLSLLTINVFVAADEVLIPATAEVLAATGLGQLVNTVNNVRKYIGNSGLTIAGILLTMYDRRTCYGRNIRDTLQVFADMYKIKLFSSTIRKAVAMGNSQASQIDIYSYAPDSTVASDYRDFLDEYLGSESVGKEARA